MRASALSAGTVTNSKENATITAFASAATPPSAQRVTPPSDLFLPASDLFLASDYCCSLQAAGRSGSAVTTTVGWETGRL